MIVASEPACFPNPHRARDLSACQLVPQRSPSAAPCPKRATSPTWSGPHPGPWPDRELDSSAMPCVSAWNRRHRARPQVLLQPPHLLPISVPAVQSSEVGSAGSQLQIGNRRLGWALARTPPCGQTWGARRRRETLLACAASGAREVLMGNGVVSAMLRLGQVAEASEGRWTDRRYCLSSSSIPHLHSAHASLL